MTTQYSQAHAGRAEAARPLRAFLTLDALASGLLGLLLAAAGPVLADPLGASVALLVPVGLFLVPFVGWLWYVATRRTVSRPAVRTVIVLNLLWVGASVLLVAGGWFSLTALGTGFVLLQAAAVAAFAGLQYAGLRR